MAEQNIKAVTESWYNACNSGYTGEIYETRMDFRSYLGTMQRSYDRQLMTDTLIVKGAIPHQQGEKRSSKSQNNSFCLEKFILYTFFQPKTLVKLKTIRPFQFEWNLMC